MNVLVAALLVTSVTSATPLVDAVKSGDRAAAVVFIDKRTDVNAAEPDGTTPLHWAVHQNDLDLVDRLLNDMGDDPDQLPILQHILMRTWAKCAKGLSRSSTIRRSLCRS